MPDAKQEAVSAPMRESDYQRVIDELEKLIQGTKQLIERFDSTGMDEEMQEDYDKLLTIYDQAIKDQAHYTQAMLKE
ncbi:hypothetical protein BCL93_101415 [Onishia taeanensis]|uniref:Uncharacterized protein n=1 Tax=Onishia taeanensis TaxID=284577 RepID=A0A328XZH4_9GAMM|nr:hypothetical protein [Halomonas taeanensis]RAR64593.1 hypothetical protein BCL93_101415 [Halomonas taeanensis]